MKIAFVTDSTADIPDDLARSYSIQVIPNLISIEGQSLEDGKGISREAFYELLPKMKVTPQTGTAAPGVYQQLYRSLLEAGADHIFSIHPSSLLSGILNAASGAARLFDGRVEPVDSGQVSLGLGFQVLAAAKAAAEGASVDRIRELLEELYHRVKVFAMLDSLEYVRRSGRVSWAQARLGGLFQVKAFVELKYGVVHSVGEARTRRKALIRLEDLLQKQEPFEKLAILHTNAEAEARAFAARFKAHLTEPPLIVNVTTVIGTHVGPNCLGFAVVAR